MRMPPQQRRRRARGHVSVLFVVILLFTAALAFFVSGAGARYLQKETVQAAADAAAFSGAVAEAKVFNTVAFINLVLAMGVAMVYTLYAIMTGLLTFITVVAGLIAASLGTYCAAEPDVCAFEAGPAEALSAEYGVAASNLIERLQPLQRAAAQVAKEGGIFVTVEAEEAGMHATYTKTEQGLLVLLKPPVETMPIEEGPANTVCGPAAIQAEAAPAFLAEAIARMPAYVPPAARLIISGTALAAEAAWALGECEGGGTGLHPQQLKPDWRRHTHIESIAFMSDTHNGARRAYMQAAAAEYGGSISAGTNFMVATAKADVYGFDGESSEDLWHMCWRGRLVLSKPKDFDIPLPEGINNLWVH
jgi:hypothetical protein